jgi:hypothetical protein
MKNKTPVMNQCRQTRLLDWLYQEEQEDDFLLGITPNEFQEIMEEEE